MIMNQTFISFVYLKLEIKRYSEKKIRFPKRNDFHILY